MPCNGTSWNVLVHFFFQFIKEWHLQYIFSLYAYIIMPRNIYELQDTYIIAAINSQRCSYRILINNQHLQTNHNPECTSAQHRWINHMGNWVPGAPRLQGHQRNHRYKIQILVHLLLGGTMTSQYAYGAEVQLNNPSKRWINKLNFNHKSVRIRFMSSFYWGFKHATSLCRFTFNSFSIARLEK